jgi:hypothetical protein
MFAPACANAPDTPPAPDAGSSMARVNKGLEDIGDAGPQIATLASADKIALCQQTEVVFTPSAIGLYECALKSVGDSFAGDAGATTQASCAEQSLCLALVDAGLGSQAGIDAAFAGDADVATNDCAAAGSADYTGCTWSEESYFQCVNDVAASLSALSPLAESQCQTIALSPIASGVAVPASCVTMPAGCPPFAFDPRMANSIAPLVWAAPSDAATDAADASADARGSESRGDAAAADVAAADSAGKGSDAVMSEAPATATATTWAPTGAPPHTTTTTTTTTTTGGGPVVAPEVDTSSDGGGCGGSSDPDAGTDSSSDSSDDGGGCGGGSSSNEDDKSSGGCGGDDGGCGGDSSSSDSGGGCGDSGGGGDCGGGGGGGSESCSIAPSTSVRPGRHARIVANVFGRSQMYAGLGIIWLSQIVRRRRSKNETARAVVRASPLRR